MKELLKTLAYEFKFKQNIPNQGTDFSINVILNWLYGIIGLVAVGFIVYAAVIFITSGGDASKAEKAKTGIFYAVVLESYASEQGARRIAMESATDNAGEW